MIKLSCHRYKNNPILSPNPDNLWEAEAVFNPSVVQDDDKIHVLYRALSADQDYHGHKLKLSTIGYASSSDGLNFTNRHQLIVPEKPWEKFGCEDPRVTLVEDHFLIFYTAISAWPPDAYSIRVAVALSDDLLTIKQKHLVTPFNAKAMALFPAKINGKYWAVLTVNTDKPPSKVAIASFDQLEDIWSENYWNHWYANLDQHVLELPRTNQDHVEVGAVPELTNEGWVLVYSHIQEYQNPEKRTFGIEAVLLDKMNPNKIIGRTEEPIAVPEFEYEKHGMIPNVIFPSGALLAEDEFRVYYGATDTTSCVMAVRTLPFLSYLKHSNYKAIIKLKKHPKNPILTPVTSEAWQAQAVFNSAAVYHDHKFHLLYRAMSMDNTSTIGYAVSDNGFDFYQYSRDPIYVPRVDFETKKRPNDFSGCEDPRVTKLGDKFYMFYTAYDGISPPKVAMTAITTENFTNRRWLWEPPSVISDPNFDNKNACLFPQKIHDKYVVLHRVSGREIALDYVDSLDFHTGKLLEKESAFTPRSGSWDSAKIGIAGPPHLTEAGWLLVYHGVSDKDKHYRLGYMILDKDDPFRVLYRTPYPILEPEYKFEREGIVPNVVFSCGSVLQGSTLFVYYGGADKVMCVATGELEKLLAVL